MADFFDDQNKMDDEDDIISLYNEATDKEEDFYHLATLDVDKRWFIVMKPVEQLDDIAEDEVLIYEIVEDEEGNDIFAPITDDALLDKVFAEFSHELEVYEAACGEECECGDDCSCHDHAQSDACKCGDDCDCNK